MIPSEIHPGPSAGDGRLEQRRTTYKPGDQVIELRKCAQCGFINRDGIELTGDSEDSPGISENITTIAIVLSNKDLPQPLRGMSKFSQSSVDFTFPVVSDGCRLCGSLNSKGNNRNLRDYGTGIDLSNK